MDASHDELDSRANKPFMSHLMELRGRIVLCIATVMLCMIGSLIFYEPIWAVVRRPLDAFNAKRRAENREALKPVLEKLEKIEVEIGSLDAQSDAYRKLDAERKGLETKKEELGKDTDVKLLTKGIPSAFLAVLQIGLWGGIVISLPLIAYQVWVFVSPGLLAREKGAITPLLWFGVLFFAGGAYLAYAYVVPTAIRYLYWFNDVMEVERTAFIGDYVSFIVKLLLAFGVAFELPLVMVGLTHVGIVTPQILWKNFRYAIFVTFIVGAVLTPPDWLSQMFLAGCLIGLYVFSILLSHLVLRKREKEEAKLAAEDAADGVGSLADLWAGDDAYDHEYHDDHDPYHDEHGHPLPDHDEHDPEHEDHDRAEDTVEEERTEDSDAPAEESTADEMPDASEPDPDENAEADDAPAEDASEADDESEDKPDPDDGSVARGDLDDDVRF